MQNDDFRVVKPRQACALLACGQTRLYALIATGELESFRDGASRKITMVSIRRYITRKLAEAGANPALAPSRRRGRPPKTRAGEGAAP